MSNQIVKSDNSKIIIIIVLLIILFIIILVPYINKMNKSEQCSLQEKFEELKTVTNNKLNIKKLDTNICSKQCCKFEVWPPAFNTQNPNVDPTILDKYIGTNLSCNNGPDGGGCLCVTKDDFNYIANHGQNVDNKYDDTQPFDIQSVVKNAYKTNM